MYTLSPGHKVEGGTPSQVQTSHLPQPDSQHHLKFCTLNTSLASPWSRSWVVCWSGWRVNPAPLPSSHVTVLPHAVVSFLSCKIGLMTMPRVGKDVKKSEPLYPAGGNVKWCCHSGEQCGSFSESETCSDHLTWQFRS